MNKTTDQDQSQKDRREQIRNQEIRVFMFSDTVLLVTVKEQMAQLPLAHLIRMC